MNLKFDSFGAEVDVVYQCSGRCAAGNIPYSKQPISEYLTDQIQKSLKATTNVELPDFQAFIKSLQNDSNRTDLDTFQKAVHWVHHLFFGACQDSVSDPHARGARYRHALLRCTRYAHARSLFLHQFYWSPLIRGTPVCLLSPLIRGTPVCATGQRMCAACPCLASRTRKVRLCQ